MTDDFLEAKSRAEDILLGGLGFGEDASIINIKLRSDGLFEGEGVYADGENFHFVAEDELSELEEWALQVLLEKEREDNYPNQRKIA